MFLSIPNINIIDTYPQMGSSEMGQMHQLVMEVAIVCIMEGERVVHTMYIVSIK